jgi:integrase
MTGSLQTKKDKFYIVMNARDPDGNRKNKWISTGLSVKGNKKRAEKMLRDELGKYDEREKLTPTEMLFSDAVREWLKTAAIKVDAVTLQGYEAAANAHVLPYFDALRIKLVDIDRHVLQKYVNEKSKSGRKDGKGGLSPASIRRHKNVLHQTLKEAVMNNIIASNPCEFVNLPQLQRFEASFYSAEQMNSMLDAIKDEPLYPLVKVTSVYGLRRSEVLGLKWDSVDFDNGTVTIKHTVSKVTVVVEKDKTKNSSSYRSFPLLPEIREIFIELKQQESENRKVFGNKYAHNDYIFKWEDGHPYSPDFVTRKFSKLLKQYGFPHIRFHDLRHSCASMLIAMGFNLKDVQEWMGHSDIKMTANIYAHLDVTRKMSMADMLGERLSVQTRNPLEQALELGKK